MEPKTYLDKVQGKLPEFLKSAGQSRTSSISISGLEYAGELSKSLLEHAEKMEAYYKKAKAALDSKETSEKVYKKLFSGMENLEKDNDKLKAR